MVPLCEVRRSVVVARPLVGAAPKARPSYEVRSSAWTWVRRSGVTEHFTPTDSLREGSVRRLAAVLSAYQVRVQVSSDGVETSPWSSTSVTRPVPFTVSYFVTDLDSSHVPPDRSSKPRSVSVRTIDAWVVPQLRVCVAVFTFHGVPMTLETTLSPSQVCASSWWPVNSSESVHSAPVESLTLTERVPPSGSLSPSMPWRYV